MEDDEVRAYEDEKRKERDLVERETMLLAATTPIHNAMYKDPGITPALVNEMSRSARKDMRRGNHPALAYSEVGYIEVFKIFGRLFRLGLAPDAEGTFVDLGSGVGNVVYGALLAHDFNAVVGIEILVDLHNVAQNIYEYWDSEVKKPLPLKKQETIVKFLNGDCSYIDWSYGDIVFANATCFDVPLIEKLGKQACELKAESFFIVLSNKLPERICGMYFDLLQSDRIETDWGKASLYIYRRNKKRSPSHIGDLGEYVNHIISTKSLPDNE